MRFRQMPVVPLVRVVVAVEAAKLLQSLVLRDHAFRPSLSLVLLQRAQVEAALLRGAQAQERGPVAILQEVGHVLKDGFQVSEVWLQAAVLQEAPKHGLRLLRRWLGYHEVLDPHDVEVRLLLVDVEDLLPHISPPGEAVVHAIEAKAVHEVLRVEKHLVLHVVRADVAGIARHNHVLSALAKDFVDDRQQVDVVRLLVPPRHRAEVDLLLHPDADGLFPRHGRHESAGKLPL
mmetsp:Transcript_48024/g.139091  ORF Transcript_48024/g.139091 Transcript_48024/m.139091 type:complete len:233 (+) Transcript_48024:193-891(+)